MIFLPRFGRFTLFKLEFMLLHDKLPVVPGALVLALSVI